MFDPSTISSEKLNDLRAAAEQAWGDDTRNEKYVHHPQPSAGQCYVTSAWLTSVLGGHVGTKKGHYFWVSPDKQYVIDLTGDQHAYEPEEEAPLQDEEDEPWELDPHQKTHRPGPVLYKRADHPLFKGMRVLPDDLHKDHERIKLFTRRANAALKGERVASYHQADLMGADPYPGSTPQMQEDQKDLNAVTLHDEPNNDSSDLSTTLYNFVVANGEVHLSPIHSLDNLSGVAGHDLDSDGPFAAGTAEVNRGHVQWRVASNIALQGLAQALRHYSKTVGWQFDGITDSNGDTIDSEFGPDKAMFATSRSDGHLLLSERPLPNSERIEIRGRTAYVRKATEQLEEWASDFGYRLAAYSPLQEQMEPWGGGTWGKGVLVDGKPLTWQTNVSGLPQHSQLMEQMGVKGWGAPVVIHPSGMYTSAEAYPNPEAQSFQGYNNMRHIPDVERWQKQTDRWDMRNSKTAEWPGGGNMHDKMKTKEDLDTFNRGDTDFQPERSGDPDATLTGDLKCGKCGQHFTREPELRDHYRNEHEEWGDPIEHGNFPEVEPFDIPLGFGTHGVPNGGETIAKLAVMCVPRKEAERLPEFEHNQWGSSDQEYYAAYYEGEIVAVAAIEGGPMPVLSSVHGYRSDALSSVLSLIKRQHPAFRAEPNSRAAAGFLMASGVYPRYSAGTDPKDNIESEIPFIFDVDKGLISIGFAGETTSDVQPSKGKFTPGGIVEGYYGPGGKVIIVSQSGGWTVRQFGQLWYHQFPQMEITSVEEEDPMSGDTTKLAAAPDIGNYLRTLVASDQPAFKSSEALKTAGGKVYVVGGAIRDALQGKEPRDIDLMVSGVPTEQVEHILKSIPGGQVILTGKRFGVYRLKIAGQEVEIALPRSDKYEESGRGKGVITVDHEMPVEHDLARRDFTVNSMAVDLSNGELIDPHGGAKDIENHTLRQTHADSFREDPTRLVRALVAHSRFGLHPDAETRQAMEEQAHALQHESPDALNKVLDKLFGSANPAAAIRLGHDTGVLQHLFPEVDENWDFDQNNPHHKQVLGEHLNSVLDNVSKKSSDPDLRLAALLHDIGKPASEWKDDAGVSHYYQSDKGEGADHETVGAHMAEARLRKLNYPVARINRVKHIIQNHMVPDFSSSKGARKFLQRVGDDHADDLLTMREADHLGKGGDHDEQVRQNVQQQRQLVDESRKQQAPTDLKNLSVNGNDLVAMGVQGPQVGQVLRQLLNDVVSSPTLNNRDTLLQRARTYVNAQPQ